MQDPKAQYYDFQKNPELIEEVLEDFRPYEEHGAIKRFYSMVRWLNGPGSEPVACGNRTDCPVHRP